MGQRNLPKRDGDAISSRQSSGPGPATVAAQGEADSPERPRLVKRRARKMTQCQATRSDGRRCRKVVLRGRNMCDVHCRRADGDLDYHRRIGQLGNEALKKKQAERKAMRKPINSVEEVKKLLGVLITEMRAAQAAPKDIASVAASFLNAHTLLRDEATIAKIEAIHAQVEQMKLAKVGRGTFGEFAPEPVVGPSAEKEPDAELEN